MIRTWYAHDTHMIRTWHTNVFLSEFLVGIFVGIFVGFFVNKCHSWRWGRISRIRYISYTYQIISEAIDFRRCGEYRETYQVIFGDGITLGIGSELPLISGTRRQKLPKISEIVRSDLPGVGRESIENNWNCDGIRVLDDTRGHLSALFHPFLPVLGCEHLVHTPNAQSI